MTRRWAVIGGGMAGLAAARRLAGAGCDVSIFDKSRGVGGRMATRRAEGLQFDHGAQFFTARGDGFVREVEALVGDGGAATWGEVGYVGTPGMSAVGRAFARGLSIIPSQTVTRLDRDGARWRIASAEGYETPPEGFDGVIVATPAPQAAPILASAGIDWSGTARARYAPCWELMIAFGAIDDPIGVSLRPTDEAIAWIAADSSKPGRAAGSTTYVIHATPAWSRQHLERTPQEVAAMLLARFQLLTGLQEPPSYLAAHRWRYALVEETAGEAFLYDEARAIGACGDWCLGARVEAAFDSGDGLGAAIAGRA